MSFDFCITYVIVTVHNLPLVPRPVVLERGGTAWCHLSTLTLLVTSVKSLIYHGKEHQAFFLN